MQIGGPRAIEQVDQASVPVPDPGSGAGEAGTHAGGTSPLPSLAQGGASLRETIARRAVADLLDGAPPPPAAIPRRHMPAHKVASIDPEAAELRVDMLIADALLDAGIAPRHPRIARAVRRIVQQYPADPGERMRGLYDRSRDVAGLAQAMLLLARLGRRDVIAAHCAPPLAVVLTYAEADGAIPAWALPDTPSPAEVEAIAGLVHALARWDARRFLGMIVAGARWVADRQQPDGSWSPPSGGERLHSCWQALRLLGAVMPNHPAVARAARFLHDSRNGDGGWGADGSAPLPTALAVLALAASRTALPEAFPAQVRPLLAPGRSGWPASRFPHGPAADSASAMRAAPGSPVVTALFALKASEALAPHSPRR